MAVTKTWDIVSMESAPTEGSLSDVVKTLGQSGNLNIFLSVWSPPLVFNFLLISALIHLEDG